MRFFTIPLLALLACLSFTGCATRTEAYDVSVRNDSSGPVIVWLTKTGGPEEQGWRSPESIAINFVVEDERVGGVLVPPGNVADTGKQKGKFERDSRAVLRVYKGEMTMSQLLANGRGSPDRADMILDPGRSRFIVTDAAGKLVVTRAGEAPPTTR